MYYIWLRIIDLFEKSVILQALLTVAVVGSCLYLYINDREVPPTLIQWAGFMMGLYGAGKINTLAKRSDEK